MKGGLQINSVKLRWGGGVVLLFVAKAEEGGGEREASLHAMGTVFQTPGCLIFF